MLHYPIARNELVPPFTEVLKGYGLCSSSISAHISSLRKLFAFMEENDIALYEPSIGKLYLNCVMANPLENEELKASVDRLCAENAQLQDEIRLLREQVGTRKSESQTA